MTTPNTLTAERLFRLIGRHDTPILIDVRSDADAAADRRLLPGSMRRSAETVSDWAPSLAGRSVVVLCAEGHARSEESQPGFGRRVPPPRSLRVATPPGGQQNCPSCPKTASRCATRMVQRSGSRGPLRSTELPAPGSFVASSIPRPGFSSCRQPRWAASPSASRATPFDIEGEDIFWNDHGERCSFDTMVEEFGLAIAPLLHLATIVRGADTARLDLAPESPGLLAASLGLSRDRRRRSRAARRGHGSLRRLLSLVPGRHRRDPQLAEHQGGGMSETALQSTVPSGPAHGVPFSEAVNVLGCASPRCRSAAQRGR